MASPAARCEWPVYVPTKGRAGRVERAVLSLLPTLVVEPQEAGAYREAYPALPQLVLPESGRGVAFARQCLLTHARGAGLGWYWMLDDDIQGCWYRSLADPSGRSEWGRLTLRRALGVVGRRALSAGTLLAMCGLEYLNTARAFPRKEAWDSYAYTCVGLHAGRLGSCGYRAELLVKEDLDLCLQLLSSGRRIYRACDVAIECPGMGTRPGGLQQVYRGGAKERACVRRMTKLWPGIVTPLVREGGYIGCRVNWQAARRRHAPREV